MERDEIGQAQIVMYILQKALTDFFYDWQIMIYEFIFRFFSLKVHVILNLSKLERVLCRKIKTGLEHVSGNFHRILPGVGPESDHQPQAFCACLAERSLVSVYGRK